MKRNSMQPNGLRGTLVIALLLITVIFSRPIDASGVLNLQVIDDETGDPIAVRMVMIGPRGREVPVRRATEAGVGYAFDGSIQLAVPSGNYRFRMTRGPEYRVMTGNFMIERTADDGHTVKLPRFVDTQKEGWLSGDLCVDRRYRDLPILMKSEDLDVVGLVTQRTDGRKARSAPGDVDLTELPDGYGLDSKIALDTREGSGLLMFGLAEGQPALDPKLPSVTLFRKTPENQDARFVVQNPFAWDLPLWLASGRVSGFVLLGDFLQYDRTVKRAPNGRPPVGNGYNSELGLGFWADDIYKNMLEAGLYIPPVAVSCSGLVKNPIGYNRVYVHCGPSQTSPAAFWDGVWNGRSVVTNGPLLRPRLDLQYPGHVFHSSDGEPLVLQMDMQLGTRDPVDYMEVVYNGRVIYSAKLEKFKGDGGIIPPFTFKESGWVVARVVTGYPEHYRAAVSAPWYIQFDNQPRISRRAVEFFQEWLTQREAMLRKKPLDYVNAVAPYVHAARNFWAQRLENATTD